MELLGRRWVRGRWLLAALLLAALLLAAGLLEAGRWGARDAGTPARLSVPRHGIQATGPTLPRSEGCRTAVAGAAAPPPPAQLSGRLGLYVAVVDPRTLEPLRAVSQDQDGLYPLASAYKQAVLWALLRQKDAGTLKLSERFDVTQASQSLGDYPFDHSDVTALATRMIQNSDNTAADLLHRRVGLGAVQVLADELHLCRTRLILPTKDWWTAQAGLSPSFPGPAAFAALNGEARLRAAEALDADARQVRADALQHRLDLYFEGRYSPDTDLGTQNVSTPAEFAGLVAAEFLRSGLSPPSQALQRQLMALGPGRRHLHVPLVSFGGKGGNGWRLLTFSGYLHTAGGEDVVYAFMQHGAAQTYTMKSSRAAFEWIGDALRLVLLRGDGGVVEGQALGVRR